MEGSYAIAPLKPIGQHGSQHAVRSLVCVPPGSTPTDPAHLSVLTARTPKSH